MSGQVDREPVRSIKVGIPNRNDLQGLSYRLGDWWQSVARRLGFSDEQIDSIDHQHQRLPEKGYAMLRFWKQTFGSVATYKTLYDALSHEFVNRQDLAEEFCLTGASDAVIIPSGTTQDAGILSGVSAPLSPTPSISGSTSDQDRATISALVRLSISFKTQDLTDTQQEIIAKTLEGQISVYNAYHDLSSPGSIGAFCEFLRKAYDVAVLSVGQGSLVIRVRCLTLESLERLWNDCHSGYLNDIAERLLVTDELKKKLGLDTVRLTITIKKENYLICNKAFIDKPGASDQEDNMPKDNFAIEEQLLSKAHASACGTSGKQRSVHEVMKPAETTEDGGRFRELSGVSPPISRTPSISGPSSDKGTSDQEDNIPKDDSAVEKQLLAKACASASGTSGEQRSADKVIKPSGTTEDTGELSALSPPCCHTPSISGSTFDQGASDQEDNIPKHNFAIEEQPLSKEHVSACGTSGKQRLVDEVMKPAETTEDGGRFRELSGVSPPLSRTPSSSGPSSDKGACDLEDSIDSPVERQPFAAAITSAKQHIKLSDQERLNAIKMSITSLGLSSEHEDLVDGMLKDQIKTFLEHNKEIKLSTANGLSAFLMHLQETYKLALKAVGVGSLVIKAQCPDLESLERLWNDYRSGVLNEAAERLLVTDEIQRKINLETLRLKTLIEEENCLICKKVLMETSGACGQEDNIPKDDSAIEKKPLAKACASASGTSGEQQAVDEAIKLSGTTEDSGGLSGVAPPLSRIPSISGSTSDQGACDQEDNIPKDDSAIENQPLAKACASASGTTGEQRSVDKAIKLSGTTEDAAGSSGVSPPRSRTPSISGFTSAEVAEL